MVTSRKKRDGTRYLGKKTIVSIENVEAKVRVYLRRSKNRRIVWTPRNSLQVYKKYSHLFIAFMLIIFSQFS